METSCFLKSGFSRSLKSWKGVLIVWLIFLILLYCGTVFIFTGRFIISLSYLLFLPAIVLLLLSPLFFSNPAPLAIFGGFFVVIPIQMALGILSWFLGLSHLNDLIALFAYWAMGIAWVLHSVEAGLSSALLLAAKSGEQNIYESITINYIGNLAGILLIASFIVLLIRRQIHQKEFF